MHSEVIAQVIDECRDKADAYLRCAEALSKLLPEPDGPVAPPVTPAPRQTRRVLGSQADYQAALLTVLTHTDGGLGIAALAAQTGIHRHSVAVALRALQAVGQIHKVGDDKTAVYRAATRPEQVLAMLPIFLGLFVLFTLTGAACLWCGRRSADYDRHAHALRLLALTTDLHQATARLKRAVVANRPPAFSKESCHAIADPRRPRS